MTRRLTPMQKAVVEVIREKGSVRPIEVVRRGDLLLPWTESTARGVLHRLAERGVLARSSGRPACYSINDEATFAI